MALGSIREMTKLRMPTAFRRSWTAAIYIVQECIVVVSKNGFEY